MVKFKVNAGTLLTVLKLVQASGRNVKGENKPFLEDCGLNISKSGIIIKSIDVNEVLMSIISVPLKKGEVSNPGLIPVKLDSSLIALTRYKPGDTISVEFDGEMIEFYRASPRLRVKVPTVPENAITSALENIPLTYHPKKDIWVSKRGLVLDTSVKLSASEFAEVVKDGEQIQHRSFPFTITKKRLTVTVQDEDSGAEIERELEANEIKTKGTVSSLFSYGFGNAFGQLSGDVKIWISNENPMVIEQKTDDYTLNYILTSTELEEEAPDDDSKKDVSTEDDDAAAEMERQLKESLEAEGEVTEEEFEDEEGEGDESDEYSDEDEASDESEEEEEETEEPEEEPEPVPEPPKKKPAKKKSSKKRRR